MDALIIGIGLGIASFLLLNPAHWRFMAGAEEDTDEQA